MELLAKTSSRLLILDTRDLVEMYRRKFMEIQASQTLDQVIEAVMQILRNKAEVQMGLDYSLLEMAQEVVDQEAENYLAALDSCIYATRDFGYELFERLDQQRAYRNGVLPYQYVGCTFGDIVLALPEVEGIITPRGLL